MIYWIPISIICIGNKEGDVVIIKELGKVSMHIYF